MTPAPTLDAATALATAASVLCLVLLVGLVRLAGRARAQRAALAVCAAEAAGSAALADAAALLVGGVDRAEVQRAGLAAVARLVPDSAGHLAVGLALGPAALLELVAVDGRGVGASAGVDLEVLTAEDRSALAAGREVRRPLDDGDALLVLPLSADGQGVGALAVRAPADALQAAAPQLARLGPQLARSLSAARRREVTDRRGTARALPAEARTSSPTPALVADLSRGLRAGELLPWFQPIVGMDDGRVRGFEALVRWQHPVRGLLAPAEFLPQVEDAGLLGALDAVVLEQACARAVSWDDSPAGPYVSVNVSAEQLVDLRFVQRVHDVLATTGLQAWRLLLEVTETASVRDPARTASVLAQLRSRRVRVAFDDFGTGYSSLSWLQQLPLDVVKIDKTFVDRLPQPATERPVVEALARLAQTMGLEVVAEGVERPEQRAALLAMGVGLGQGWLWHPALPAERAGALVRSRAGAVALR